MKGLTRKQTVKVIKDYIVDHRLDRTIHETLGAGTVNLIDVGESKFISVPNGRMVYLYKRDEKFHDNEYREKAFKSVVKDNVGYVRNVLSSVVSEYIDLMNKLSPEIAELSGDWRALGVLHREILDSIPDRKIKERIESLYSHSKSYLIAQEERPILSSFSSNHDIGNCGAIMVQSLTYNNSSKEVMIATLISMVRELENSEKYMIIATDQDGGWIHETFALGKDNDQVYKELKACSIHGQGEVFFDEGDKLLNQNSENNIMTLAFGINDQEYTEVRCEDEEEWY
jgi:hypothetical protein